MGGFVSFWLSTSAWYLLPPDTDWLRLSTRRRNGSAELTLRTRGLCPRRSMRRCWFCGARHLCLCLWVFVETTRCRRYVLVGEALFFAEVDLPWFRKPKLTGGCF